VELSGLTLVLDAAVSVGSIAVLRDGALVAQRSVAMRGKDDEPLTPAVLDTLHGAGVGLTSLARVICGEGPGSFTSLRIAGAISKGIVQGTGCALHAIPSLALIVAGSDLTRTGGGRWLATLDAMRGDRYLALVTIGTDGDLASYEALGLAPAAEMAARAAALDATPIGPDAAIVAAPQAAGITRCLALLGARGPVDLASWEPVYGRLAEAQAKRERGE
jgi:tRNA threonylcarbamoyladenosine biosynthesis protein TsaB